MNVSSVAGSPVLQVDFPEVPGLADSRELFDPGWAWQAYCREFGEQEFEPHRVSVVQVNCSPGKRALALYEVEWHPDVYLPSEQFTLRKEPGKVARVSRFPDDPDLPGLAHAAHPETALGLVKEHVMALPPRRIRVSVVRYRPGSHAVLRHRMGKARFYARVMRPAAVPALLRAAGLVAGSSFAVPRIAGHWREGAVIWASEIPGKNLRQHIRAGNHPDPEILLTGLESLWSVPSRSSGNRPFDLVARYASARESIGHAVRDYGDLRLALANAVAALDPFSRWWKPVGTAHNDFYDDQLLLLPDDRMALVDFEEAGPGDPMLDVGNFLAHLHWASRFGSQRRAGRRAEYHGIFRDAALLRFGWSERDLAMREAICLFRLCTSPIRRPQQDWLEKLEDGLSLVNGTIS